MKEKRFLIIDGSSLLYRAFYALPPMNNGAGLQTNAIYGFTTMILKLMEEYKPQQVAVAFDKGKVTFRNELYTPYKGTRQATPPELSPQFPATRRLLEALGIAVLEEAGFEADDIIGTLAQEADPNDCQIFIVTGDRDALQLVTDQVTVLLTRKGITDLEIFDPVKVQEKFQVTPAQIVDLKGLMGDSSDNIPGVPGVGAKTAVKLLQQFGTVEAVLDQADQIKGAKLQEKISQNQELARLSKQLARINCSVPLSERPESFLLTPQVEDLLSVIHDLGFKSLKERIFQFLQLELTGTSASKAADFHLQPIVAVQDLAVLLSEIKTWPQLVFELKMSGLKPQEQVERISLWGNGQAYELDGIWAQNSLWLEVLQDPGIQKITWNSKAVYRYYGNEEIKGLNDLSLMAYLLDPSASSYEMEALVRQYEVNLPLNPQPGAERAWQIAAIAALAEKLPELIVEKGLSDLYETIEKPLAQILADMEVKGIAVDLPQMQKMSTELTTQLQELLSRIYDLAGEKFNVNSTKQLGHILFEKLNMPIIKKTKTGYSTDAEVLERLAAEHPHPIIADLLNYRILTKLKSTYLDGLQPLINQTTNRIHTTFHQTVTATGRLSSSDPNLQNIPIRTDLGRHIREFFVPGQGWDYLVSADYSQIELRVLAHMANDPHLIEAFQKGQDIHAQTAAQVFGVPLDQVSSEMRSRAKAVNFGIVYGISDYGLSRDLHVSRKEASEYIESYFQNYGGVKQLMDRLIQEGREQGYVTTLFGRRRYLPELKSSNYNVRSFAERMAMNTPIQGTAADIIKKAMINVAQALKIAGYSSRLLLQVHDELILEVPKHEVEAIAALVKEAMEQAIALNVPLIAEVNVGKNWALAK